MVIETVLFAGMNLKEKETLVLESKLQQKILKRVRERGCYAVKYPAGPYSRAGVPDILGCIKRRHESPYGTDYEVGEFFAIEVKRQGEKPTKLQEREIRAIRKAEGRAIVIRSMEELQKFL